MLQPGCETHDSVAEWMCTKLVAAAAACNSETNTGKLLKLFNSGVQGDPRSPTCSCAYTMRYTHRSNENISDEITLECRKHVLAGGMIA